MDAISTLLLPPEFRKSKYFARENIVSQPHDFNATRLFLIPMHDFASPPLISAEIKLHAHMQLCTSLETDSSCMKDRRAPDDLAFFPSQKIERRASEAPCMAWGKWNTPLWWVICEGKRRTYVCVTKRVRVALTCTVIQPRKAISVKVNLIVSCGVFSVHATRKTERTRSWLFYRHMRWDREEECYFGYLRVLGSSALMCLMVPFVSPRAGKTCRYYSGKRAHDTGESARTIFSLLPEF